jgi:ferredoxin
MNRLYEQLCRFDATEWHRTVETLAANIHEIDRDATRIWFAFYPLRLRLALENTEDRETLVRKLGLMGDWGLANRIDSSHRFLYSHRFWPQVKSAVLGVEQVPEQLGAIITQVADAACRTARVDRERLLGLAAIALMTLRQVGPEKFAASPGQVQLPDDVRARSTHQVVKARAKDDWQGVFGFLRGTRKLWTVTFDEADPDARFTAIHGQDLATAAQSDKREYRSKDARCIPNEGPIPVECRAASCGTCWVGVLGGAEKLSPVEPHEAKRMRVFGYAEIAEGSRPLIRLACQAKAGGAVSIVIPPWNGFISRL